MKTANRRFTYFYVLLNLKDDGLYLSFIEIFRLVKILVKVETETDILFLELLVIVHLFLLLFFFFFFFFAWFSEANWS